MIMFFSRLKTLGFIILLAISSWLIIHVLTVFGFFLAIAYPMWWFFSPKQTTCLFCRSRKDGEICPFCRQPVSKQDGSAPKTFLSATLNGFVILVFSLVSIGIVFLEIQFLHILGYPPTPKTASFAIPSTGEYRLGEVFPMKLEITGIKTPINAVQADISFNPQKLEVIDITTTDSFATIFIQKEINNKIGYARLSGGIPSPGFSGADGVFGTVFLRGKVPGLARVKFLPTTLVLANDGKGTNVLKDYATVSYLILPEKVSNTENTLQKNITKDSHTKVLGASTTSATQMIFYDEGQVLGASTIPTNQENQSIDIVGIMLTALERVDNSILTLWAKIF